MVKFLNKAALLAVAAAPFVAAQTSTLCDPTKKTCPADPGLNQASYTVDFTKGMPSDWSMSFQSVTIDPNLGADFSIDGYDDAPTMQSNWYLFFGKVECSFQAAPGAGIVSSFILISDDLDEIDWETIGSKNTEIQSNYFGKGNTTSYDRGGTHAVNNPNGQLHTYTIDWKSDKTTWAIDGAVVRTLNYADAVGGQNYPQTPMQIRLGNWVAGRPGNAQGTIDWAGGLADLSKAPFNFYVKTCSVTNYNPAASYTYGDLSGSFGSINKGSAGNSQSSQSTTTSSSSSSTNTLSVVSSQTSSTPVSSVQSTVTVVPSSTDGTYSNNTSTSTPVDSASSSTVTLNVGGSGSTSLATTATTPAVIGGATGTSTTTGGPLQVTTNAAIGSYGKTSLLGLGMAAVVALVL